MTLPGMVRLCPFTPVVGSRSDGGLAGVTLQDLVLLCPLTPSRVEGGVEGMTLRGRVRLYALNPSRYHCIRSF